jgi:Protein of unknown function (DUF3592)
MGTRRDWQQLRTSRSRLFPPAIATLVLLIAGGVLLGVGLHDHGVTDSVPGWTSTTGTVIGSHESTGSGGRGPTEALYAPVISFRDQQGAPVTFTGPAFVDAPRLGATVRVEYNPSDPRDAHDLSSALAKRSVVALWAGVALLALAVLLGILGLRQAAVPLERDLSWFQQRRPKVRALAKQIEGRLPSARTLQPTYQGDVGGARRQGSLIADATGVGIQETHMVFGRSGGRRLTIKRYYLVHWSDVVDHDVRADSGPPSATILTLVSPEGAWSAKVQGSAADVDAWLAPHLTTTV